MVEQLQHRMHRSGLRVLGAIDEPSNARVGDGAGAHCTGLDGHVEIAVEQAIVGDGLPSLAQCKYLRVRGGIVGVQRAIAAATHDASVVHDDGPDGDFAQRQCALRLAQRLFHPEFIGEGHGKKQLALGT